MLQRQARALGDPTRHAVFRLLADAGEALGVAELTARFGLNHNAVRQHLAKLVAAGLVEETKAVASGPGRPRLLYRVAPAADSRWAVVGPYEQLSVLLTEMVATGETPVEVGRRVGRGAVSTMATHDDAVDAVTTGMARHGFDPLVVAPDEGVELVLQTCPYASAATTDAGVICGLHLGIAEGMAEATGGWLEVDELEPRDPRDAGCRLRLVTTQGS